MLFKLYKEDKIHRIVKGQYILPDDMEDISTKNEKHLRVSQPRRGLS